MKEKIWGVFRTGVKILMGPLSLLMGKEIPILPWLLNPMNTGPLLIKSFFPPKGEGGSKKDEKVEKKEKDKVDNLKKQDEDENKKKKKEEEKPSSIGEIIAKMFKDEGATSGVQNKLIAANQQNGAQGVIDSIQTKAEYEEEGGAQPIIGTVPSSQTQAAASSNKEVLVVTTGGGGSDPYEELDFLG